MEIKAFDISDEYSEIDLPDKQQSNINKIFFEIVEGQREKNFSLGVKCCLKNENRSKENALYNYYLHKSDEFDFSIFASALHDAEKIKDGSKRKRSIQEGFLFIKSENKELYLMKLEKIKDVDSSTFEIKGALGTDNNYYKLCIFSDNIDEILIFDKNTRLASYWYDNFLGLTRVKDEHQNTHILIDLIKEKKLFNNQMLTQQNISLVYQKVEDFMFNNENFQKLGLLEYLKLENILSSEVDEKIFSIDSMELDAEFNISKKSIKEKYKKKIQISSDTFISTDNYIKLKKRQGIKLEGNELTLVVGDDFIDQVRKELA